jgi:hypothetical protein
MLAAIGLALLFVMIDKKLHVSPGIK